MGERNKLKTTDEWVTKASTVHKNKYDYSKVEYKGAHVKVIIICPDHGEFTQMPAHHANKGVGCGKCGKVKSSKSRILSSNEFITKSNLVHDYKYDYSKVEYKLSQINVVINCPIHGDFTQMPTNHLSGKGCARCGDTRTSKIFRLTIDEFIKKAVNIHGYKYSYILVNYRNNHEKIDILCLDHGIFVQTPMSHLSGNGCPSCSRKGGFKPDGMRYIYILEDIGKTVLKIGITNNIRTRMYALKCHTPFKFKLLHTFKIPGEIARGIEKGAHRIGKSANFSEFQGCTEWFAHDVKLITYVRERCNEHA